MSAANAQQKTFVVLVASSFEHVFSFTLKLFESLFKDFKQESPQKLGDIVPSCIFLAEVCISTFPLFDLGDGHGPNL